MLSFSLSPLHYRSLIEGELREDMGVGGDLTTEALFDTRQRGSAAIVSRESGVLAGLAPALHAFTALEPEAVADIGRNDGDRIEKGEQVVRIAGRMATLLTAERTALNILSHLSGVATAARRYVDAVQGTGCRILDTRKTLPGLGSLQKYAVRCGGAFNHRYTLDGAVMVKDNHLAGFADPLEGILHIRSLFGPTVRIELEVDSLEQLEKALDLPVDIVLLDNMNPDTLKSAVSMIAGTFITEASGGVTLETVRALAETGVDFISVGGLTHSVVALDMGLDFE